MSSVALLLYLPFVGAGIALIGKVFLPDTGRSGWIVALPAVFLPLAGMTAFLVVTIEPVVTGGAIDRLLGSWNEAVAITMRLDGTAWLSTALVVVITGTAALSALGSGEYGPRFYFFVMMLVAGMQTVVLTGDVFTMFVGFEIIAIAAYVLIAFDQTDQGLLASLKYLILSSVGIIFFLFGVFLVYRHFGTLSLFAVEERIAAGDGGDRIVVRLAVVALVVGIGVRTAFIPFHTWLPEAHAYAPHPISAILSGVLIKVSFFAMVRVLAIFGADYLMPTLMWIGGITAVTAVIWALAQTDAKRLLAYHSISQMGYVLAAFGAAGVLSLPASFYHAINHAFFKSLLFLAVGTMIHMQHQRNLFRIVPVGRRAPLLAILYGIGAMSIAGIPPFNGYVSKQIVTYALEGPVGSAAAGGGVSILLSIAAIGTVASFLKLSRIAMPGAPPHREETVPAEGDRGDVGNPADDSGAISGAANIAVYLPLVVLAILSLGSGIFGRYVVEALGVFLNRAVAVTPGAGISVSVAEVLPIPATFYSGSKAIQTIVTVVAGYALYRVVVTRRVKHAAHVLQRLTPDIRIVLVMFIAGLGVFSVIATL
ncbi:MAG: complex I subunit 5 family protein [Alkalispirochaeta sp.]